MVVDANSPLAHFSHSEIEELLLNGGQGEVQREVQREVDGEAQGEARKWVLGGTHSDQWHQQLEIKRRFGRRFFLSFGLHPWWASALGPTVCDLEMRKLEEMAHEFDLLGEVGLDYHRTHGADERAHCEEVFRRQVELAFKLQKPLILHVVQAHGRVLEILKEVLGGDGKVRGYVHGFMGSPEVAQAYISLGLKISLGPRILTAVGGAKVLRTVDEIGPENFLFETDLPQESLKRHWRLELLGEIASFVATRRRLSGDEVWTGSSDFFQSL